MFVATDKSLAFEPANFRDEKELQDNIEQHPGVLDVIARMSKQDTSLLLIGREFSVQSGAVDFLATDEEGNLYIIETKLAENPELRRTVIGQVIEYASNLNDMPYEVFEKQCSKYLGKSFCEAVAEFYQKDAKEDVQSAEEYSSIIQRNIENGIFNIVVVANNVNFEIQRLFNFIDQITQDELNFLVVEINKYEIDSRTFLYSNVVWAAKYIKSLFSRRAINEDEYVRSKSEHVQGLIRFMDKWCIDKGLSKVSTTKGISWKGDIGGSIHLAEDLLNTNWSTLKKYKSIEFDKFKKDVMNEADKAGFKITGGKTGGFKAKIDESLDEERVEKYLSLAYSVIERHQEGSRHK